MTLLAECLYEEDFKERVDAVRERVYEAIREHERLEWLIGRLPDEIGERPVAQLREWLELPTRWPGQYEKAVAALAVHPDEAAATILESWSPPENLALLHRVACSYRRQSADEI